MSSNENFLRQMYDLGKENPQSKVGFNGEQSGKLVELLLSNFSKNRSTQLDARIRTYTKPIYNEVEILGENEIKSISTNPKERQVVGSNLNSEGRAYSRPAVGYY